MEIYLCVDTHDGNDPLEAKVDLPIVPRKGDIVELWYPGKAGHEGAWYAQTDLFPVVDDVYLSAYRPDYVRVFLRFDGFDLDEIKSVMAATHEGLTP